jgi:hypothetical protein
MKTRLIATAAIAATMVAAAVLAGCGGGGGSASSSGKSPAQIAATLGCTGVTTSEVELFAQDEVTCDYQGGSLTIVTFASSDQVQRWLSAANTLAGKTGTMVVGPTWAIEAGSGTQATAVQRRMGGTID